MIRNLVVVLSLLWISAVSGQEKYFTKTGSISFFSKTDLEDIDAHNRSVTCVLDTKSGNVQFSVLMKGFEFKKALMQEHFNEDYVESDKFPKGEFKGQIVNNNTIDYSKEGTYPASVKGQLSIHGQTKEVETEGTVTVKGGKIQISSEFPVTIADYKITVAAFARGKVAKTVSVKVSCVLEPLK